MNTKEVVIQVRVTLHINEPEKEITQAVDRAIEECCNFLGWKWDLAQVVNPGKPSRQP